ncbi:glycoside hydrolase family 97 protein [Arachidicoccus ginsenosidimutans]|uniref:glycoside hydrolase family 97 protein n=1 Tax=Arachidicoccus sp. BS20 TaxID=1850526 RepID=UPI0018D2AAF8|nr:glycoside hydrolase family 97 protein [Arachidicoccus sp. BS20]
MKKIFLLLGIIMSNIFYANANDIKHFSLQSPDKKIKAEITVSDSIVYDVRFNNSLVLNSSGISMTLNKAVIGKNCSIKNIHTKTVNQTIDFINGKFDKLKDNYNELTIDFDNNYSVIFRAYDEGIAYRFVTNFSDSIKVMHEQADFNIVHPTSAIVAETDNYTAWELSYTYPSFSKIPEDKHAITPALFTDKNGTRIVIAESDVLDYPGMYLQKSNNTMQGLWANYPSKTVMGSWGNFVSVVKERAPYIAYTKGSRSFPWRIVMVTNDDKSLLTNELVYKLATPCQLQNTNWIKPGKAAWEWWHDALLPGADIPSGMDNRTTQLYNYYVDFAAKNHLEYMMIDAGWSNVYDIQKPNPKIDIRAVISHAKSEHVGVFLWCVATSLLKNLDANLDYIKSLGAAGLKVDFFDRDDQLAIASMEQIAKAAAARHLMIDFHGCTKPTGLQRAYPDILNYEAVRGQECDKWDTTANPEHHLTFIFTRMLGGPLDYTPGGMRNKTKADFKPIGEGLPSVMGTRCHELAMYVVFDQPLAMLCDAPTVYEKYPDVLKFLSIVPTTFDDTKVLAARVGEYALLAKRKGNDWFVGGMTNWTERNLNMDFSFLPKGKTFTAEIYSDTKDDAEDATKYNYKTITVTHETRIPLHFVSGGGMAMYIHE